MSEAAITSRSLWRDFTPSTISAGFLAVLVSYAGPLLIYLQAAQAMNVSVEAFTSWTFAISMAAGLSSIALSLWLRAPIVTAWSAPGTVLLISLGTGLPFAEIVGAFVVAASVIFLIGVSGLFDRLVNALPPPVCSGIMAGILFGFGVKAMAALGTAPGLFTVLMVAFLVAGILVPRYAAILLLCLGLTLAWTVYKVPLGATELSMPSLELTWPRFSFTSVLSLSVPLIIVTLTGQFLPGMAILRANGFDVRARPIIVVASLASLPAALLGGVTTALASVTMALCASPESDPDPARRYTAGVACGIFFCFGGLFAGTIVKLLTVLPGAMIALLTGLALMGAILKSLTDTVTAPRGVQAGVLTFMVTTANFQLYGIGSAFWGVVVGTVAWHVTGLTRRLRSGGRN